MDPALSLDLLFIGDIVGRPGREAVAETLSAMRRAGDMPDVVVANGENAAAGYGLTRSLFDDIQGLGVDVVTLGNHAWDKREILEFIDHAPALVRPANYPAGTPGRGFTVVRKRGVAVGVLNLMGRTFMPTLDCPFRAADAALAKLASEARVVLVDFHAEATSEKQALARYLDGRVSAVFGTHTHVQTADETLLPGGTAYLTDAGMTGPSEGVIGMDGEGSLRRFLTGLPGRLEVAQGPAQFNAVRVRVEANSGRAVAVERVNRRP